MAFEDEVTENISIEFTLEELYNAFNKLLIDFKRISLKIRNLENSINP